MLSWARWLGLVGETGGSTELVPSDDGARVGQRRTGSCGGLAAATDPEQTRKELGAAHDQVCDFTTGGEGRSAGSKSCEHAAQSLLLASTCHFEPARCP